jgi:hypothetical protein
MPLILHSLAHRVAQMWVFAGGSAPRGDAATIRFNINRNEFSLWIAQNPFRQKVDNGPIA